MGMYTNLRFKGIIKKEFIEEIQTVMNESEWIKCKHATLLEFSKFSRSDFIPFGSLPYAPSCWEGEPYDEKKPWFCPATDGFETNFDIETGYWSFQCSLKNYENEIEFFINNVVPLVCEEVIHCEKLYEEDAVSEMFTIENGEIKILPYGIRYEDIGYMPKVEQIINYEDFKFDYIEVGTTL